MYRNWKDLLRLLTGSSTQDEDIGTDEVVLTLVRKEGEIVKPTETRCQAQVGKGQCKNEITFDMEADTWVIWCEEHLKAEETARAEGGERVVRVGKK